MTMKNSTNAISAYANGEPNVPVEGKPIADHAPVKTTGFWRKWGTCFPLISVIWALNTMRDGDFLCASRVRTGSGKVADTFNEIVAANQQMAQETEARRAWSAKKEERESAHEIRGSRGAWGEMGVSVNTLVEDLLRPTAEVTRAIAAVAQGNLTQTVRLDVDGRPLEGEFLRSASIVNTMIQQLGVFTAEVTRVAREVGTDGKLGGQALVPGVAGTWKDLTDSVNSMASNLTGQVRNIASGNRWASGDLPAITVDVRGEILQAQRSINSMVTRPVLRFQVTRVAREVVGTDGVWCQGCGGRAGT
jgi:methyl-accepting chemotaxis protein